jgi:hypothetical protein
MHGFQRRDGIQRSATGRSASLISSREKGHNPNTGVRNKRMIADGGQTSPDRTHAICADETLAWQDWPGSMHVNHQRLEIGTWPTILVDAP